MAFFFIFILRIVEKLLTLRPKIFNGLKDIIFLW